jgi:hypothetical protein
MAQTTASKKPMKRGREWLDEKHLVWQENVDEWVQNERRLEGGHAVVSELRRFDWEVSEDPEQGYQLRQDMATYVNFPEMFADTISGHLLDNIGDINFGGMGEVVRKSDQAVPSRAEQIYYNVDGVGNDGSQLKAYIAAAWKRASATGHRWHFVEAAKGLPGNRENELAGQRPYVIEFSPIRVTNWDFAAGTLLWAIVRVPVVQRKVQDGVFVQGGLGYMMVVRKGVTVFDSDDLRYNKGGQFFFDETGEDLADMNTNFDGVKGEIPMIALYVERSKGTTEIAKISRCVVTDLGNVAVSYMNLSSAADYDAWDAAKSTAFICGASQDSYNLAMNMFKSGSKYAPLEGVVNSAGQMSPVSVVDSAAGAVPATIFKARLEHKLEEARWLAAREAIGEPGSSGVSKIAGFGEAVKPRLVMFASELETWLNALLYFFELRFAVTPSASATWVKEFDLLALTDKIMNQFNLEKLSGLRSPTLGARAMVDAAEENGLMTDDAESEVIRQEYLDAGERAVANSQAAADMMAAAAVDQTSPNKPPKPKPGDKTFPPVPAAA